VEVVAAHYLAAYEMHPEAEDASGIKQAAASTLARAGERASSLAAHDEAQRYFEQAADLADGHEKARLREQAGISAFRAGRLDEAQGHLGAALDIWNVAGDTHAGARISARLGEVEWQAGKLEAALERMETAFRVLSLEEPDADEAELAAQLARLHYFDGTLDLAIARAEVALQLAEAFWLPELLAEALITKGLIFDARGRTEEALALLHHGVQIALEQDLPTTAGRGYVNLSATLCDHDRYEEALSLARRGIDLVPRAGSRLFEAHLYSNLSDALAQTGRWEEALEAEEETSFIGLNPVTQGAWIAIEQGRLDEARRITAAHPILQSPRDVQDRAYSFMMRSALLRAEGREAEALPVAEEALEAALSIKANVTRASLEVLEAAFALGDFARVEELVGSVDALRPGELRPSLRAHVARFRARLASARGRHEEVEPGFKTAAGIFREFGLVFWLAVTQLEHGEWLVERGRADEAQPLLDEARVTFERLQATPWLERLDRMAPREQVPA
jgi:tetratricopeptide (TPR) repeat protein